MIGRCTLSLLAVFSSGALGDIALPTWPFQGDPATQNAPLEPSSFSAVQLPDSAVLDWASAAPFILVLRAMSNAVLNVWDGYQPLAIVAAPITEFVDLDNVAAAPAAPRIADITLTATNELVTVSRPRGSEYWLARSADLVQWDILPMAIDGSPDPFVYSSPDRATIRFYEVGAAGGLTAYHYVLVGIRFVNDADAQAYAGKTTLLSNTGVDQLPALEHSSWIFLTNFSDL